MRSKQEAHGITHKQSPPEPVDCETFNATLCEKLSRELFKNWEKIESDDGEDFRVGLMLSEC